MTLTNEEIIAQLKSVKLTVETTNNAFSALYLRKIQSIVDKLEKDQYSKEGKISEFYDIGMNRLSDDLRSVGFFELAVKVTKQEFI